MRKFLLLFAVILAANVPAFAFPEYLAAFRSDPMRKESVDGCGTCHISPQGGGDRNEFGLAFESANTTITPGLRATFPQNFTYPVSRVSDALIIHFSDPANKQVVVESGGKRTVVDVEKKTVDGKAAEPPPGGIAAATPAPQTAPSAGSSRPAQTTERNELDAGLDEYSHEGAFLGANVVNLPNGKPTRKGGFDFFIGHRFSTPACIKNCDPDGDGPQRARGSWGDLFGLDSGATIGFGVRVGLHDRVSVAAFRTNSKQLELSGAVQITRQNGSAPVTLQVRGGFEGRRNFASSDFSKYFHEYSPFLQVVATRTFFDRVSVVMAPTFAFNTRDEESFFLAVPEFRFGAEHNDTIGLGIGAGIRLRPTVSLVGEYIPRLRGFRGELKDRPGVSMGLQKSTYRHTFELVLSRQQVMTTTQYVFQGNDAFRIGFNIFRRIR